VPVMLAHLASLLFLPLGCIRFDGLPDMPAGTASDPRIYASPKDSFNANVAAGRWLARAANISWDLVGTAGEVLATTNEIRERFGGVIFVGDSQIREVAWAGLQMLTPRQKLVFSKTDKVFGGHRGLSRSACVPQSVGKTGFTATCTELSSDGSCELWSPFHNKSHAEAMRRLLLTRPHQWDGLLSVHQSVCDSDFFVSYQATWGAMPVIPTSLPSCLHPQDGSETYALPHKRTGVRKPVLWIVDGCGLHEMEFCDARRDSLPQHAFNRFPDGLLRSGTIVYQPVGAGFLMKASNRFRGECEAINADQIAAKEVTWLQAKGVPYYDYTKLTLQYAPLMYDAIHFTYYWVPCSNTFPELARMVAQLAFQQGVGRPAQVCGPGTPPSTPTPPVVLEQMIRAAREQAVAGGARNGTLRLHLGQEAEDAERAYSAALHLSKKASKGGAKGKAAKAEAKAGAKAEAKAEAKNEGAGGGLKAKAKRDESLSAAISRVAAEFGGRKQRAALNQAITKLATRYEAHDV